MRAHNFNPGPAALPLAALTRARDELLDFEGSGMSIIEHSHRGPQYEAVHNQALQLIRSLLLVPDTHTVLFLQGGAALQFAMVPLNFLKHGEFADFVLTGVWSEKAIAEARVLGQTRVAATTKADDGRFYRVPTQAEVSFDPRAAYAHTTSNNTMYGTQFKALLDTGTVPHICDMSSDFLSRPIDFSKLDLVYAGAQKNLGPSGVVVVIARKSFLAQARTDIPVALRYTTYEENNSLYNTPPTFAIYLVRNVLEWVRDEGGVTAMAERAEKKSQLLYGLIDRLSSFYRAPVEKASRSLMNVVFHLPSEPLTAKFVSEAAEARLVGLKGHRVTGGIRVSAYNAVSVADIEALVSFMTSFAKANG